MPTSSSPPGPPAGPPIRRPWGSGSLSGTPSGGVAAQPPAHSAARSAKGAAAPAPIGGRPQPNRAVSALVGPVGRAVASLDNRLLRLAASAKAPAERKRAQVEIALLAHLRRGLAPYAEEARAGEEEERIDTVLMETLLGGVEHALAALADLDADAGRRAGRLLGFVRELVGELTVLGVDVSAEKARLQAARKRLVADASHAAAVLFEVETLWPQLAKRLEQQSPRVAPSLLDEWLRAAP